MVDPLPEFVLKAASEDSWPIWYEHSRFRQQRAIFAYGEKKDPCYTFVDWFEPREDVTMAHFHRWEILELLKAAPGLYEFLKERME